MSKSDTDRRDFWWLDDVTSIAIISLLLLSILGIIVTVAYLAYTGEIDLGANFNFVGTVDISILIYGGFAFLGFLVYNALTDIYGQEDVQQSQEQFTETVDDTSDVLDE